MLSVGVAIKILVVISIEKATNYTFTKHMDFRKCCGYKQYFRNLNTFLAVAQELLELVVPIWEWS